MRGRVQVMQGGIVSAAMDGERVATLIIEKIKPVPKQTL
jgi:hypothetical protein